MDQKELQKLFTAYLIQQSGAKNEQELTDFVNQLGKDGLKQMYQKFLQSMQQGQSQNPQMARNGAKLNYIKSLRGNCPEGFELQYFKEGGQICSKCVAKREKVGAVPYTPMQGGKGTKLVQDFKKDMKSKKSKCKNPQKKQMGGILVNQDVVDYFKCGGKAKKAKKKESGGVMETKKGLVKKSKGVPIKQKFIQTDKCGGKAKKKK